MGKVGALSVTSRSHTSEEHGDTYRRYKKTSISRAEDLEFTAQGDYKFSYRWSQGIIVRPHQAANSSIFWVCGDTKYLLIIQLHSLNPIISAKLGLSYSCNRIPDVNTTSKAICCKHG